MDEVSKDARDPARARHDGVWFDMWLSVVVNVKVSPVDEWALTPPTVSMLPAECCDLKKSLEQELDGMILSVRESITGGTVRQMSGPSKMTSRK